MPFELERLDHVALTVSDVDSSVEWYRDVLGLEHVHEEEWGRNPAFLTAGATGLALFPARGSDPPPKGHPDGLAMWHLAFRADRRNFDAARQELESRDISYTFSDHGLAHSIYFHDPDGHLVEITTYEV